MRAPPQLASAVMLSTNGPSTVGVRKEKRAIPAESVKLDAGEKASWAELETVTFTPTTAEPVEELRTATPSDTNDPLGALVGNVQP